MDQYPCGPLINIIMIASWAYHQQVRHCGACGAEESGGEMVSVELVPLISQYKEGW